MSHFFFDTTMLKNPNQKEIPHASPQGRGVSKIDRAAFVIMWVLPAKRIEQSKVTRCWLADGFAVEGKVDG